MSRCKPPDEARVVVGVHEHLDVHQRPQRRVGEDQDAFDDDRGAWRHGVAGLEAVVAGEIVLGHLHRLPLAQRLHVLDQQVGFE